MSSIRVSDEHVQFYRKNGYVQFLNVLSPDELAGLRSAIDEAVEIRLTKGLDLTGNNPEYDQVFHQKVNLWRDHEGMKAYVHDRGLAEAARRLGGFEGVRLFHDHALIKMPGPSKASAWHQDWPYWPMNRPGALSCWMALDDVCVANGCMQFIPGSQAWGPLPPVDLVNPQDLHDVVPDPDHKDFTPVPCEMPAGSCTFHHGLTFHYAGPNQTDKPRRALVIIYMPEDVQFTGKDHPVTMELGLPVGQPFETDQFPRLA